MVWYKLGRGSDVMGRHQQAACWFTCPAAGEVEVMLSDVMATPGCQLELQLTDVEGGR